MNAASQYRSDTTAVQKIHDMTPAACAGVNSEVITLIDSADNDIWTLQRCIEYAMEENITLQKSRIAVENAMVDTKSAKGALFPSLSFSTSHNVINRPYQENSTTVSGTEILQSNSSTSYTGNYGLNAQWTIYNGGRNRKTIKQEELNTSMAQLDVNTTAYNIMENIAQLYIQILYADESIDVNRNTLEVSQAQLARGKELLASGSISKADYAQLEAQVSNDKYQLVTAETTLRDYKLQLKQLLETDEGAKRIGEVALVPASSPINQKNILFYNTLFDENASCHIALGQGYPGTVVGGEKMSVRKLLEKGVNDSIVHEDIMIGARDTDIVGLCEDGSTVQLFKNGQWAF